MTQFSLRVLPSLLLFCGAVALLGGAHAQPTASTPSSSGDGASAPGAVVDQLVEDALQNNLSLRQKRISLKKRRAALAQTKGEYLPSLDLEARYTRSRGGRTIDFPVGDAVNPAYRALSEISPGRQFPRLQNREISLLRRKEQRTELQLRQPLYRPKIRRGMEARAKEVQSQKASVEAERRRLVRDVKTAYYRFRKAHARVEILEATQTLVRENRRASRRLREADKVTENAVHRAEAEVLSVRQRLAKARASVRQARRRLNAIRNRPPGANIPKPKTGIKALVERRVRTAEKQLGRSLFSAGAFAGGVDREEPTSSAAGPGAAGAKAPGGGFGSTNASLEERPILRRLDAAAEAAAAQRRAAETAFLPTVSLAVDAGIQGRTYGFSGDRPFASASIVLKWNLFDGLTDRRRVERRRLEAKRLRVRRAEVEQRLTQKMRAALEEARVARRSLQTAEARVKAAKESFCFTRRRHDTGRASQATLIDARRALTEAKTNLNVTRYDLLIRLAELEYVAGLTPTQLQE